MQELEAVKMVVAFSLPSNFHRSNFHLNSHSKSKNMKILKDNQIADCSKITWAVIDFDGEANKEENE